MNRFRKSLTLVCLAGSTLLVAPLSGQEAEVEPAPPIEVIPAVPDEAPQQPAPAPREVKKLEFQRPDTGATITAFIKHVESLDGIEANLEARAMQRIGRAQADEFQRSEAISQGLVTLYPELDQALDDLFDEKIESAITRLKKLAESDDPYLAAHAIYFMGRAEFMADHFEQAAPLFEKVVTKHPKHTLYAGEALFYLGIAQAGMLQRPEAIQSLSIFWNQYEDAPERLLVNAIHMIYELQAIQDGRLTDVEHHMDFVHRRIAQLKDTGEKTQEAEKNIIVMLDKLIEEAEEKENSGGGGGGGGSSGGGSSGGGSAGGQSGGQPGAGADQSSADGGPGDQNVSGGPAPERRAGWEPMRDRDRAEIENALKTRFPDRYQELIRQYYESLSRRKN